MLYWRVFALSFLKPPYLNADYTLLKFLQTRPNLTGLAIHIWNIVKPDQPNEMWVYSWGSVKIQKN